MREAREVWVPVRLKKRKGSQVLNSILPPPDLKLLTSL